MWHHGSPNRKILDAPDRPTWQGRFHRAGGPAAWYGSSSEAGAWAEFVRSLPEGADPAAFQRRIGRVDFELTALDLTSPDLHRRLGIDRADLVADDLAVCQTLAELAADAGFDAVIGPSAAVTGEQTLAVFEPSIRLRATKTKDLGVHSAT